jgi:hypothetical protein
MKEEHERRLHAALGSRDEKGEKKKTHVEEITYKRAHNGGFHAKVEHHHEDGSHSHTEHHVITGPKHAEEHLDENMGDQPDIQDEEAEATPPGGAPDGGAGGAPPQAGPPAGAGAPPMAQV